MMDRKRLYKNIKSSIISWLNSITAVEAPTATYYDFDSHAQASELPAGTLIGPAGVGLDHSQNEIRVVFGLGVAVDNDPNLFELTRIASALFGACWPQEKIEIVDADTGEKVSWMVITTPVALTPVTNAEVRSQQFVTVHALLELSALENG